MKQVILGMIILPTLIFPAFALDKAMKSFFAKTAATQITTKTSIAHK